MNWEREIDRANRHVGPEDDPDPAVNGDIDSLTGEEDESGYSAGEGDGYEEFLDEDDEREEDEEEDGC